MPQDERGRTEASDEDLTLADLASSARTTSTASTAFDTTSIDSVNGNMIITAVSGTNPTLDVILQTSPDSGTTWQTVGAYAQQTTTVASVPKIFGPLGDSSRWSWTIGGTATPTFTFSIASTVDRDN
jgi:hypothetical protein